MPEATLQILDLPIVGLTLEERTDGLSELTIDLETAVPAAALAKLLGSLAELYNIGYAAAGKPDVGFISFGNEFILPQELFITKLEIGTPNKVKVSGASSVLDDLYKIMKILTLAVALVSAPSPTGSGDLGAGGARTRVEQNVVVNPPSYSPENPSITILDLHKALNENIAMKRDLDRALANGEMPLHAYLQEIAKLDAMYKELTEAMKVTRARPGNT